MAQVRYCVEDGFQFVFLNDKPQQCPTCLSWYKRDHEGIRLLGDLSSVQEVLST